LSYGYSLAQACRTDRPEIGCGKHRLSWMFRVQIPPRDSVQEYATRMQ